MIPKTALPPCISQGTVTYICVATFALLLVGCSPRFTGDGGNGTTSPQSQTIAASDVPDTKQVIVGGAVTCTEGKAKGFDCQGVDLLSFLPLSALGGDRDGLIVNGMWGWIDSATKREFAVVGRSDGTAFVEVTDPVNPKYLGMLPLHPGAKPTVWRDVKVYKNHAFIVADGGGAHGMQIFDLTQLRSVKNPSSLFQETAHYDKIASVHSIVLNEATGYVYNTGSNGGGETCGGGLHMVDVRAPVKPLFAGCAVGMYVHDAQCVMYRGPDQQYRGREICLNAVAGWLNLLAIVDVTDKGQPKKISHAMYPNASYTHQGWLTEDQRYFFVNDELDEKQRKLPQTRTIIFDLADLDDPVVMMEFPGTTPATDHNLYIRGRYMYQSNYTAGLRVIDILDPKAPREVAYFDTHPDGGANVVGYDQGTWTNFPYFSNGTVAVTSKREGLFLVRYRTK